MLRFLPLFGLCALLLSTPAQAMPGAGGMDAAKQTFAKADTDKSDSLSKDEFLSAFKGMKEEAFAAIDTDGNGQISRQEWQNFSISHSMGREGHGTGMPQHGQAPAAPKGASGLPVLTPPANAPAAPAAK